MDQTTTKFSHHKATGRLAYCLPIMDFVFNTLLRSDGFMPVTTAKTIPRRGESQSPWTYETPIMVQEKTIEEQSKVEERRSLASSSSMNQVVLAADGW